MYISLLSAGLLRSLRGYPSRWTISVSPSIFFYPAYQAPENLVLLLDGISEAAGASTRGSLSETLESLSEGRLRGEIDKALKMFWIPITSPLLTVRSSLQLSEDETDGRVGRASAVETTPAGVKTVKGDEKRVRSVYSSVFVLISAHAGRGKTKRGAPWSSRHEHAEREDMLDWLFQHERVWPLTAESTFLAPVCSCGPFYLDSGNTYSHYRPRPIDCCVWGQLTSHWTGNNVFTDWCRLAGQEPPQPFSFWCINKIGWQFQA